MITAILITLSFGLGFYLRGFISTPHQNERIEDHIPASVYGSHIAPEYYGYFEYPEYKGWVQTNQCTSCCTVALDRDMSTFDPCRNCGSKVVEGKPAKWLMKGNQIGWVGTNNEFLGIPPITDTPITDQSTSEND